MTFGWRCDIPSGWRCKVGQDLGQEYELLKAFALKAIAIFTTSVTCDVSTGRLLKGYNQPCSWFQGTIDW